MIDSTGGIRLNHGLIFFHHSALLTNDWVFSFPLSTDYGCKRFRIVLLIYCLQIMSKSSSQRVFWYGIRLWYEVYLTWFFFWRVVGGYKFLRYGGPLWNGFVRQSLCQSVTQKIFFVDCMIYHLKTTMSGKNLTLRNFSTFFSTWVEMTHWWKNNWIMITIESWLWII